MTGLKYAVQHRPTGHSFIGKSLLPAVEETGRFLSLAESALKVEVGAGALRRILFWVIVLTFAPDKSEPNSLLRQASTGDDEKLPEAKRKQALQADTQLSHH
jgi:hypothetical protein